MGVYIYTPMYEKNNNQNEAIKKIIISMIYCNVKV